MMKVTVKKRVFQKLSPKFKAAIIAAENVDNKSKLKESKHLLEELEKMTKAIFNKETLKTHHLIAPWEILKYKVDAKAKHYQTSVEKLLKKVIRSKSVKSSSVLGNLVNYISLKYIVPAGIDDLDKIKGEVTFDAAAGKEKAAALKRLKKNALYYRDSKGALGTKLDYWKSSRTKPSRKTKNFMIHLEALPPLTDKKLKEITKELVDLIISFCGGEVKSVVLGRGKNSASV